MKAQLIGEKIDAMIKALETTNFVVVDPKTLFNDDGEWISDTQDELPQAFVLDRYNYHISCFVNAVKNGVAYLTGLGEDSGDDFQCPVDELPVYTILDLIGYADMDYSDYMISTSDGHDEDFSYYDSEKEAYDTFEKMKETESDIHLFKLNENHEFEVIESWCDDEE